ncbi:MAG: hypothetical protein RQ724_00105 [Desulfuromonadales bacterium]|nr:hypothetical protein [Desulfuromonadales bacterium]
MTDELLNSVIQLEKHIQQQLQAEQKKAEAWLEGVRAEQEKMLAQAEEELIREEEKVLLTAQKKSAQVAKTLVERESRYCRSLEKIDQRTVLTILRRQLQKILPGYADDHQDVQN